MFEGMVIMSFKDNVAAWMNDALHKLDPRLWFMGTAVLVLMLVTWIVAGWLEQMDEALREDGYGYGEKAARNRSDELVGASGSGPKGRPGSEQGPGAHG